MLPLINSNRYIFVPIEHRITSFYGITYTGTPSHSGHSIYCLLSQCACTLLTDFISNNNIIKWNCCHFFVLQFFLNSFVFVFVIRFFSALFFVFSLIFIVCNGIDLTVSDVCECVYVGISECLRMYLLLVYYTNKSLFRTPNITMPAIAVVQWKEKKNDRKTFYWFWNNTK